MLDFYTTALNLNVHLFTLYTLSSGSSMVITSVHVENKSAKENPVYVKLNNCMEH